MALRRFVWSAFPALICSASLAAPPPPSPSASLLQSVTPPAQAAPGHAPASDPALPVGAIEIAGNVSVDVGELRDLVADAVGQTLTMAQLREVAARIARYYLEQRNALAYAMVAPRSADSETVRITVIEVRYGSVGLDNVSRADSDLLVGILAPFDAGAPVDPRELDHKMLLLSDLPGVVAGASLTPDAESGAYDLTVRAQDAGRFAGRATLGNYDDRYTGRLVFSGVVEMFEPLHSGDMLSLSLLGSGPDLQYGRASYETLLDSGGPGLGTAFSALHYRLIDDPNAPGGHGTEESAEVWLKQTLARSRDFNLAGRLQFAHKQLYDDGSDIAGAKVNRHIDELAVSFDGSGRIVWLPGASYGWNLAWTEGSVFFADAQSQALDAAGARTVGRYGKASGGLNLLQTIAPDLTLTFSLSGQWANANLDVAEKTVAGGPDSVRAYDLGAAAGDAGLLAITELRRDIADVAGGQLGIAAFFDAQRLIVNRHAWTADRDAGTLIGTGAGLRWTSPGRWSLKADVALPAGSTPDLTGVRRSPHVWAMLGKDF